MSAIKVVSSIGLLGFAGISVASTIDHLASPALYDNAEQIVSGHRAEWGQTFISQGGISGVKVYIGDPSRPGDPLVDELVGPADLVLYDISDLLAPIEIARTQILSSGNSKFGLSEFHFGSPIPTTIGTSYFFAISTLDTSYGVGLRDQYVSTYAGGAEAWRNLDTGEIMISPLGRDLSFEVSGVPLPGTVWLFAPGIYAVRRLLGAKAGKRVDSIKTEKT
jgi:hypothetical protein